jgi:hypothetical protein
MVVVLEKQMVRRTSRLIRVRRLMCLLSIVCMYCLPTVCYSGRYAARIHRHVDNLLLDGRRLPGIARFPDKRTSTLRARGALIALLTIRCGAMLDNSDPFAVWAVQYLGDHDGSLSPGWYCSAMIPIQDSRSTALKHLRSDDNAGWRSFQGVLCSWARFGRHASSKQSPMSCKLIGKPSREETQGTVIAWLPVRLLDSLLNSPLHVSVEPFEGEFVWNANAQPP